MTDPAPHALAAAAASRRGDARQRAHQALHELHRIGASISFAGVARAAEVSRKFLYSQPDLREHIERARSAQRDAPPSSVPLRERATDASIRARLHATLEDNKCLRDDNASCVGRSPCCTASCAKRACAARWRPEHDADLLAPGPRPGRAARPRRRVCAAHRPAHRT